MRHNVAAIEIFYPSALSNPQCQCSRVTRVDTCDLIVKLTVQLVTA
jgi:hypothetical protein